MAKALAGSIASYAAFDRRVRNGTGKIVGAYASGLNTSIPEWMNNRCKQIKMVAYYFMGMGCCI